MRGSEGKCCFVPKNKNMLGKGLEKEMCSFYKYRGNEIERAWDESRSKECTSGADSIINPEAVWRHGP